MSTSPELYAFWRYDLAPYVLGGVGNFTASGNFYAKNFQMSLDPKDVIAIYPIEAGIKIKSALEDVRLEHEATVAAARKKAKTDAIAILPQLKGRLTV